MIDAKRKAFIFLTIAFILAVAAAGFIINQIQMAQDSLGETVKVAAADKDIQSYTSLEKGDITWVEMPKNAQVESFIQQSDDIDDSITVVNLKEGDLVTKNVVRKKVDIPADHRIVWLNPSEIVIVDQGVAEGDLVDVISVTENKEKGVVTQRLLQNIKVVQMESKSEGPSAIKVSLPVNQAERLIHAQNSAKQIRILRVNQVMKDNGSTQETPEQTTPEHEQKETKPAEEQQETNEAAKDKPDDKKPEDKKDEQ
ncbi:Flp pilus assembly protein CpaB [Bacillus sp. Marseille-Q3570]|uniref:Flp pilus assembly protein CpaB n=1 Tax=Bacillus sp. Marseille-Q3570 TaxID=2963522 RepID=UPI0021B76B0C|nr:Flp pilus assembly protein CpaB [Bacillus sp. Marseille-Q3570]